MLSGAHRRNIFSGPGHSRGKDFRHIVVGHVVFILWAHIKSRLFPQVRVEALGLVVREFVESDISPEDLGAVIINGLDPMEQPVGKFRVPEHTQHGLGYAQVTDDQFSGFDLATVDEVDADCPIPFQQDPSTSLSTKNWPPMELNDR